MAITLKALIKEKERLMEKLPNDFYGEVKKQQLKILRETERMLDQLQLGEDGRILTNQFNIGVTDRIMANLQQVFYNEEYLDAVTRFSFGFDKSMEINDEWLTSMGYQNVSQLSAGAKTMMQIMKQQSVALLVDQSAIESSFFAPIKQTLTDGVASGMGIRELDKAIRTTVVGNEDVDGRLMRYSKQIASDAIATGDRNYSANAAESIGVEFYRYSGGIISDTRSFCQSRNGKYFHHNEIEEWGVKPATWSGRFRNTNKSNIFTWLGGYNCKHSIIPVSEAIVPKEVLIEAMEKGYYKPSDAVKERLLDDDVKKAPPRNKEEQEIDEILGRKKWNESAYQNKMQPIENYNTAHYYGAEPHANDKYAMTVSDKIIDEKNLDVMMSFDRKYGIVKPIGFKSRTVLGKGRVGALKGYNQTAPANNMVQTVVLYDGKNNLVPINIRQEYIQEYYDQLARGHIKYGHIEDLVRNTGGVGQVLTSVYAHERGHYIANKFAISRGMKKYNLTLSDSPSEYGEINEGEFFAESFSMFNLNPSLMKKNMPKLFSFVVDILNESTRIYNPSRGF